MEPKHCSLASALAERPGGGRSGEYRLCNGSGAGKRAVQVRCQQMALEYRRAATELDKKMRVLYVGIYVSAKHDRELE
jgi:hypothetical protein